MILLRSGIKGNFVLFPKEWPKRWREPVGRRFQTPCDMLIGGCACGRRHTLEDDDTECLLEEYDAEIESLYEWRMRTRSQRVGAS